MGKYIRMELKEIEILLRNIDCCIHGDKDTLDKIIKKLKRASKPIKISSRKGKGRGLQYWVCEKISELLKIPYNQQDDQCQIHSREMGISGSDVILRGKALEQFPFSIECKSSEGMSIRPTVKQVKANQKEGTDWMIVYKEKAFAMPVVIIDWNTFEKILKLEK